MDFEYQPANHLAFRLAKSVLVPEVLPLSVLRRYGASQRKLIRYPGLKEELYIADFELDPRILQKIGIVPRPRTVVVARTPPTRAIYHPSANPLFEQALYTVCSQDDVACVVLGHGWSGTREQRLDAYAERFAQAGFAALVFDYRHFGASEGEPRQLLDIRRQQEDSAAALAYARTLTGVVHRTILQGETIYERGKGFVGAPRGRWLRRA